MQTAKMGSSAAVVAGAITRAQAVATGHDLPLPRAARSPEHGRHTARVGSGLLAPAREMVERGERLRRRIRATPPCARPLEEDFVPHLPVVLAGLFDSVDIAFASGPLRSYALRAEALAATVNIASSGRWFAADGTAEGSGLVSLAMWREDVDVTAAVLVLRDLLERAGVVAPSGGGA